MVIEVGLREPHAATSKRVIVHENVKDAIFFENGCFGVKFDDGTGLTYGPGAVQYTKVLAEGDVVEPQKETLF